jgi:hypothetical protein
VQLPLASQTDERKNNFHWPYFQPTEVKLFFIGWGVPTEIMFLSSAFSKT